MSVLDKPVFIVGAPRCGKKMTAEVLARDSSVYAFQYEMNFLWRYGHAAFPHDRLTPQMLSNDIKTYIQDQFTGVLGKHGKLRIVDRTDHNVVRLDYVNAVFPDSFFIFVVRDPRAAVASAIRRRQEKVGFVPYLKKSLTVPTRDLIYYGFRYLSDIAQARLRKNGYKNLWGIRTPQTLSLSPESSLAEKCAVQWKECVLAGLQFSKTFPPERFLIARYEKLTRDPVGEFKRIFDFAALSWNSEIAKWVTENVHTNSMDKWKQQLSDDDLLQVQLHTKDLAQRLSYSF